MGIIISCVTSIIVKHNKVNNIFILVSSCDPSPCMNDGQCTISLNKAKCQCSESFTGSLCQYEINNLNIQGIIDSFYKTKSDQSINDLMSIILVSNNTELYNTLYNSVSIY
jgi:hypothetical protein